MDAAACRRRAAQTVAQVVYSAHALEDVGRSNEPGQAAAIQSAVGNLSAHPLVGRRIEGDLREIGYLP